MDFPNELLLHNFQIHTLKVHKNIRSSSRSYYSKDEVHQVQVKYVLSDYHSWSLERVFLRKPVMTVIIGNFKTKCSKQWSDLK